MKEEQPDIAPSLRESTLLKQRVQVELIRILYRLNSQVIYLNYPSIALTAMMFWGRVPAAMGFGWVLVSFGVTAVRNGLNAYYLRYRSTLDIVRWTKIFVVGSTVTGLCWGSIGVLFLSPNDIVTVALLCTVLIGASGVAIAFLAVYVPAYTAFVVPTIMPLVLRLAWQRDTLSVGLSAMCLIGLGGYLVACRHMHRAVRNAVRLKFENIDLVAQLTQEKKNAEEANIAKSRFLAAASHDLRQPLQALSLSVSALDQQVTSAGTRRTVSNINLSLAALESLFNKLLDISRLDAGVIRPETRDFRLPQYLERICNDYLLEAQAKGLVFEYRVDDVVVRSDPQLLERILRNYLSNAIRYTDVGRVVLRALAQGNDVLIEVADTGRGISRELHKEIFREFFQIENSERDRTKGLGLGLAIVERLARLLGSPIAVDSEPGRGSVFSVLVPAGGASSVEDYPGDALDAGSADFAGLLVLIVDDEGNVRESMTALFKLWGCQPLSVASEAEAIEQLRAIGRAPDAVIADYRLRDQRTGAQAIRRIHEEYGNTIPALIVTGDTAPDRLREATASGYRLLHKPVSAARLSEFLRSCLCK